MSRPTVAIVGASSDREKYGNKSVRAHVRNGYEVYPINPKGGMIEGLKVYQSLSDVPVRPLDRISLYVPSEIAMRFLPQIAAVGCDELWFNPGSEGETVLNEARRLGLEPLVGCSIVDLGARPEQFAS